MPRLSREPMFAVKTSDIFRNIEPIICQHWVMTHYKLDKPNSQVYWTDVSNLADIKTSSCEMAGSWDSSKPISDISMDELVACLQQTSRICVRWLFNFTFHLITVGGSSVHFKSARLQKCHRTNNSWKQDKWQTVLVLY